MADRVWPGPSMGLELSDLYVAQMSQFQKDRTQPYDMQLSVDGYNSLYIAPESALADYVGNQDHPEADDDDDDDDDEMDFDLPSGPAANYLELAHKSTQEDLDALFGVRMRADERVNYSPSVMPIDPLNHNAGSTDPLSTYFNQAAFTGVYAPPVQSVDPMNLQISQLTSPTDERVPSFEPSSPVMCELMSDDEQEQTEADKPTSLDGDSMYERRDSLSDESDESDDSWSSPETPEPAEVNEPERSLRMSTVRNTEEYSESDPFYGHAGNAASARRKRGPVGPPPYICELALGSGVICNKAFTRPYDLSRHQETIHAPVRKQFRCEHCGDSSKTFSRLDALSRHIRAKHPGQ